MEKRLPKGTLGGQAVMEGVMMKGPGGYSVAVRRPDQKIEVKLEKYQSIGEKHAFCKLPLIRGVVNFVESLTVGMNTLTYSSSFYEEDEVETKVDRLFKDIFKEKAESVLIGITVLISIIIAVALFMVSPAAIAEFIGKWVDSRILLSIIEGVLRLTIFILYVILISLMEDIKRVFMYHGAEHKTINCYESGAELTPENVAKYSRYHKRCGTSFLFVVMFISIFVFMFITAKSMWLRMVLRVLLVPVVAAISYEFIRLAGRHDNAFFNILSKPGMWVQKLTTKEPDEEMIQVAIVSVEAVLFGQSYVDAVNQAQGIGEATANEKLEDDEKQDTNPTPYYNGSTMKYNNIVLGDDLGNEYEEDEDFDDEFPDEESEENWENDEEYSWENDTIKETESIHSNKQDDLKEADGKGSAVNKNTGVRDRNQKRLSDLDEQIEDFDIAEFEKSFFEE